MAIKNSEDTRNVFGSSGDSAHNNKASKKAPEHESYRREKEADKLREELLLKAQKEAEKELKRLEKEAERRRKLEAMKQESLIQQASELRNDKKKNHSKDNKSSSGSVCASTKPEEYASPAHSTYEGHNAVSTEAAFVTFDEIWCEEIYQPPKVVETKPVPYQLETQKHYEWKNQKRTNFQRPKREETYVKRRSNTGPYKARMQSSRQDSYKVRSQSTSEYSKNEFTDGSRYVTNAVCAPEPEINIWEVRQSQMESLEQMKPHNETEEEAMLRQALDLSRRQALEDQKRRSEIDEEYYLQMKYLSENPEFAAQLELNEQACGASDLKPDLKMVGTDEDTWGSNDEYVNQYESNKKTDSRDYCSRKSANANQDIAGNSYSSSNKSEFQGVKPKYKQSNTSLVTKTLRGDAEYGYNNVDKVSYNYSNKKQSKTIQDECWGDDVQSYELTHNNRPESTRLASTECYDDATWDDVEQSHGSSDKKQIVDGQDDCDEGTWGDIDQSYKSNKKKPIIAAQDNYDDEGTWDGIDQSYESSNRKQIVSETQYFDDSKWECADHDKAKNCNEGNRDYVLNEKAGYLDDQPCLEKKCSDIFNKNKMQVETAECSEAIPDKVSDTVQSVCINKENSFYSKLQSCSDLQLPPSEIDECSRKKADKTKMRPSKHNEVSIFEPADPVFKHSPAHSRKTEASVPVGEQPMSSHCYEEPHLELKRKTKKKSKSDSEHDTWDEDLEHMLKSVKGVHFFSEEKSSTPNTELHSDFTLSSSQPTASATEPAPNAVSFLQESHTNVGVNKVEQWLASTESEMQHVGTVSKSESGESHQTVMKSDVSAAGALSAATPAAVPSSSFPNLLPGTASNSTPITDSSLLLNNKDNPVQVPLASPAANLLYPPHLPFSQPIVPPIDPIAAINPASLLWQQAAMCANPFLMQQLYALQMFYVSRGVPIPQGLPVQAPFYPQFYNMLSPNPNQGNLCLQQPVPGFPVSAPASAATNTHDQPCSLPTTLCPPGLPSNNVVSEPHEISINPPVQPHQSSAATKLLGVSSLPGNDKKDSFVGIHPPKPASAEIQRQPMYRYQDLCLMMQQSSTDRNSSGCDGPATIE